ncbi:FAD-dependent oxidoreductase, partial [Corynebacterium neomassiliense]|uniref:FAD-dependent oxidoreductase n=1 Tax=Corynebacterium neomassiliense TaxID=2079482 RepID=UPI0010310AC2
MPDTPRFDPRAARLNAARRESDLTGLRERSANPARGPERIDVLVIGAGVTGAGAALDAATRGLDVLLVDAGDLGGPAGPVSPVSPGVPGGPV